MHVARRSCAMCSGRRAGAPGCMRSRAFVRRAIRAVLHPFPMDRRSGIDKPRRDAPYRAVFQKQVEPLPIIRWMRRGHCAPVELKDGARARRARSKESISTRIGRLRAVAAKDHFERRNGQEMKIVKGRASSRGTPRERGRVFMVGKAVQRWLEFRDH